MAALIFSLATLLLSLSPAAAICGGADRGSTLEIIHVNSPCSPFRPKTQLSWEDSVLQMQASDKSRLQFLSSLVAGRSVVPVASGRAVTQNPTYIVRAKIGTPPQQLLVALDTSNDAAWIPCSGCVGCSSATYNPAKSTTSKPLRCGSPQCAQVTRPRAALGNFL